jgi:hypothetical protein
MPLMWRVIFACSLRTLKHSIELSCNGFNFLSAASRAFYVPFTLKANQSIQPIKKNSLKMVLDSWSDLEEDFPDITDCPPVTHK